LSFAEITFYILCLPSTRTQTIHRNYIPNSHSIPPLNLQARPHHMQIKGKKHTS